MKPPINYYGGKARMADWIASLMGPHRVYVEPFSGSAAVLFAKEPSTHEVLNDLAGDVVNFFRILRERPDDLIAVCRLTPYARDEFDQADIHDDLDDLERARRFYVRITQGFGKNYARPRNVGWSASVLRGSNNARSAQNLIDRWAAIAERLRDVTIENRPALYVLTRYAVHDAVVYLDPPYLASTRTSLSKRAGDYAEEYNTIDEHVELAAAAHDSPATVFLSGYHSELYDDLYADWDRVERDVTVPTSNFRGGKMRHATEVVWSNRPIGRDRLFEMAAQRGS